MTTQILACIDASPFAEAICDYAVWAAKQLAAPITLVHALDKALHTQTPDLSGSIGLGSQELLLQQLAELDEKHSKLALQRGRRILDAARAHAVKAGITALDDCLRHGQLVETLTELESQARLLVLGKRGFSSADAHGHMGLHVERVIRSLHTPVLLTQQHYKTPQRIMLAYDGSATAQKSLQMLSASPLCRGLPVHLVMAGADTDIARAELDGAAHIMRSAGFDTKTAIVAGEPDVVLHQYQQDHVIDLLVMGAYGHSRIRQFIVGSTTTAMICKAKCSLLILR
ncbi:universal stress protein [Rheinheimera gaetbuli]